MKYKLKLPFLPAFTITLVEVIERDIVQATANPLPEETEEHGGVTEEGVKPTIDVHVEKDGTLYNKARADLKGFPVTRTSPRPPA